MVKRTKKVSKQTARTSKKKAWFDTILLAHIDKDMELDIYRTVKYYKPGSIVNIFIQYSDGTESHISKATVIGDL